jgi:hypothetical protein
MTQRFSAPWDQCCTAHALATAVVIAIAIGFISCAALSKPASIRALTP